MNLSTIKAWASQQTTIYGLMLLGGAGVAYLLNVVDWRQAASAATIGAIGAILQETPAQVIQQARSIIASAETIKVDAATVTAEAAVLVKPAAPIAPISPT